MVEIDGIDNARFQEVSSLDVSVDLIEIREGGDPTRQRKVPGLAKFANITLKRGYTSDRRLYDWFEDVMTGRTENIRKNVSIVQLDMAGKEALRWNLFSAFPVKYTAPAFNAKGNELAIESMELAYERVEMAK
jgi:phage tail-like protein